MSTFRKTSIPATRSTLASLKVRRRLVIIVLALCLISGVAGLVVAATRQPPAQIDQFANTDAVAVAETAGLDYLAQRNSSVPTATGVLANWGLNISDDAPRFEVTSFALAGVEVLEQGTSTPQTVKNVKFRVNLDGAPYTLIVPVVENTNSEAVLGGQPSLMPADTGETDVPPADYGNYEDVTTNLDARVRDSIERWVQIYPQAGADDADLLGITGDQNQDHTYRGLGGWTGELVNIRSAVPVEPNTDLEGYVVQVIVRLQAPANVDPTTGEPNTSPSATPEEGEEGTEETLESDNSQPQSSESENSLGTQETAPSSKSVLATYDLYVLYDGTQAQPPVVAWGAAGSLPTLTPYMNAE